MVNNNLVNTMDMTRRNFLKIGGALTAWGLTSYGLKEKASDVAEKLNGYSEFSSVETLDEAVHGDIELAGLTDGRGQTVPEYGESGFGRERYHPKSFREKIDIIKSKISGIYRPAKEKELYDAKIEQILGQLTGIHDSTPDVEIFFPSDENNDPFKTQREAVKDVIGNITGLKELYFEKTPGLKELVQERNI